MRSALHCRRAIALAVLSVTLASCARATHIGTDLGPIDGSTASLQPKINSASGMSGPRLLLSVTIPQRCYVNVLMVSTQVAVGLMGRSQGDPVATEQLDAGRHRLLLSDAAVYLNADRHGSSRRADDPADPLLGPSGTGVPSHAYVLVIATAKPLSLSDFRESLALVDLHGPDDQVLQRIADAVGMHSLGAWAASAARPDNSSAPF